MGFGRRAASMDPMLCQLGNHQRMSKILATDFGIWPTFSDIAKSSDMMLASKKHKESLANYLLLYDQIVIPTGNLQVLPVLRMTLGDGLFDELVRQKEIVLVRYSRWFGYGGGGTGLVFFEIRDNPSLPKRGPNLSTSYFKPLDESIDIALASTNPQLGADRNVELRNLLLDNIIELPMGELQEQVPAETYSDILNSSYLRDLMSFGESAKSLDSLRGINSNQLTIYNPHSALIEGRPEINSVLRIAFENFLLGIASFSSADTITSDSETFSLVKAKGQRYGRAMEGDEAFLKIQDISGVPNVGAYFSEGRISPQSILELRYSDSGVDFRNWFGGVRAESVEEKLARYRNEISRRGWLDYAPVKLLRIAATSMIGLCGAAPGAVASVADSFLLEKWFSKKGPQLFMDDCKVMLEDSIPQFPRVIKGRDRNRPCACGSGRKYKRCHGRTEPSFE